jgi:hypothetical protein
MGWIADAEAWAAMAAAKLKEIGLRVQSRNGVVDRALRRSMARNAGGAGKKHRAAERTIHLHAFQRAAFALHCMHVPDSS